MKQIKCESCMFGNSSIGIANRVPFANARFTVKVQVLTYWCGLNYRTFAHLVFHCKNYKPDPKKIQIIEGKRFKQNVL